jgi:Fic family protein
MRAFNYDNLSRDLLTPGIINLLSAIHEYKGREESFIKAEPDILNTMLEIAKIQSTGASNRIEGIYTSNKRLEALVKLKAEPRNRSEAEIAGYREVLALIHESYEYISVSPNIILQLHRDLYAFHPSSAGGAWKNSDNLITETDASGKSRVRFVPIPAYETADAMERLCSTFNEASEKGIYDPLLLIPIFVFDFLCIHPFNDGNGRMSRLLTLLLLYRAGYTVGKYVSMETIIENTKESYYQALQDSSAGRHEESSSYNAFVKYYLSVILNSYKEFSSRVGDLQKKRLSKPDRIRNVFENKLGKHSKKDIMLQCPDISMTTVERTLSELLKEGYILKVGAGKSTVYVRNNEK